MMSKGGKNLVLVSLKSIETPNWLREVTLKIRNSRKPRLTKIRENTGLCLKRFNTTAKKELRATALGSAHCRDEPRTSLMTHTLELKWLTKKLSEKQR